MQSNDIAGSNGSRKIKMQHHQRMACVYIRQSTAGQVRNHQEGQQNQLQMVERAGALGWPAERIQLITEDLGKSGRSSEQRTGFRNLLSDISLAKVGIVFCYEVSRLARNSRDWHQLLEAAALFDTLIADYDGIYDLHAFNDRLLLGLKGTMSEAELHLLHLRMAAGRRRQLERGDYQQILPTGLLRLASGDVVKDPDEQVQQVIKMVFDTFSRLKSGQKLLRYFHREQLLLPRRQIRGPDAGTIIWKAASSGAVYSILTNPAYAGTFVYGRRKIDKTQAIGTRLNQPRQWQPREAWEYVHHDHYPAYISWERFLQNQQLLSANRQGKWQPNRDEQGAIRHGEALLQGIVYCGHCGHQMHTQYTGVRKYGCYAQRRMYGGEICTILSAEYIDPVVVNAFFEALQPAQLDVLDAVLQAQNAVHTQLQTQWQQRLQRVEYDMHLAERQYNAVDPDNRLVAATLERRWEAKLQAVAATQREFEQFQQRATPTHLSDELREQFQTLGESLPTLWGELPAADKKALLRSLILRVNLTRVALDKAAFKIVWVSGHCTSYEVRVGTRKNDSLPHYAAMVSQIQLLWQAGEDDLSIAKQLTAAGFYSARIDHVSAATVAHLRHTHGWYRTAERDGMSLDGHLSVLELAQMLSVSRSWIYNRIRTGRISTEFITRHPEFKRVFVRNDPTLIQQLRSMKENAKSK